MSSRGLRRSRPKGEKGRRCAGEWTTIELMTVGVRFLTKSMRYDVPEQSLRIRLSRVPAAPESGFLMTNVRRSAVAGMQQAGGTQW